MKSKLLVSGLLLAACSPQVGSQTDAGLDAALASASENPPNIVFILADDLGYYDLSLTGSQIYQTPAIDALAAGSVRFTQAYSSYPRCTPSRYGLMTATYPINENKGELGAIPAARNPMQQFKVAGYKSHFVGKWHLGDGKSSATGYGFDSSWAAGETGGVHSRTYPFNKTGGPAKGDKSPVPDVKAAGKAGDYISDLMTDNVIDFIKDADPSRPFLTVLSYYSVHTPLEAKPEDKARNNLEIMAHDFGAGPDYIELGHGRQKMKQDSADYAGMVENVDENVARIMAALNDRGIADNTIVVFSSDHGGLSNDGSIASGRERELATSNLPLKAGKGHLYEGGIRVPLFVSWPKAIAPRVDTDSIVLGMDVYPTLLDLALDGKVTGVDGESFENVLAGRDNWKDRTVYWHSVKARPGSTGDNPASAMRKGDYKLLEFFDENRIELYNVKTDIGETTDLSASMPQKVAEMKAGLTTWRASKGAKAKGRPKKIEKAGKVNKAKQEQRRRERREKRKNNKN